MPPVVKSLRFKTLAPVCLTLYLLMVSVTMKEFLSTSSCLLESLTKCYSTFCVDIQTAHEMLRSNGSGCLVVVIAVGSD